jgi:hypothetical protein
MNTTMTQKPFVIKHMKENKLIPIFLLNEVVNRNEFELVKARTTKSSILPEPVVQIVVSANVDTILLVN